MLLAPLRPATPRGVASGRGVQMSENLFKNSLFWPITVCCWPTILVQNGSKSKLLHFWAPPCGQQHLEGCLRAGGGQTSQNLFKNSLFEQTSVCCWPSIVVKIDPKRSFFTFGPPLPARNTSKVASGLLLGCSWAAPGCSWAAPGCSWAPPGSSWAPPHTHKYTHKPS